MSEMRWVKIPSDTPEHVVFLDAEKIRAVHVEAEKLRIFFDGSHLLTATLPSHEKAMGLVDVLIGQRQET